MINKWAFEALDKTLGDLMRGTNGDRLNKPFGGKVVVLDGDFRQILLIIPKASRVNSSILWKHCEVIELTKNMLLQSSLSFADVNAMKLFVKWILDIGEGKVGHEIDEQFEVEILDDMLLPECNDPIAGIV